MDAKYSAKATVVYAIKDIPEGQTIPSEALEERQIEQSKSPEDALASITLATGRTSKYGITAVSYTHLFVNFDQVHLIERQSRPFQSHWNSRHWPDPHNFRRHTGHRPRYHSGQGLQVQSCLLYTSRCV